MKPDTSVLLHLIDTAYDRRAWHGTNLKGSLRGVSAADAAWRPGAGRHNIWEVAVHCAFWKYVVWRRLTGERQGTFPISGHNWFARPGDAPDKDKAWRADVALLAEMHSRVREAAAAFDPKTLGARVGNSRWNYLDTIAGIASHDLYHAGQIQLLKRLRKTK